MIRELLNPEGAIGARDVGREGAVDIAAPGKLILMPQADYHTHYRSTFENGNFAGQWVDGSLPVPQPIPQGAPGPDGGWRQIGNALEGAFSFSETAIGTDYPANALIDAQMASAQTIPSGTGGCKISYLLDIQGEPTVDFLQLFASLNGGPYPATPTASHSFTQGVSSESIDLSNPAFQGATIQLALRFASNGTVQNEGVRFDDLGLRCLGGDYQPAQIGLQGFGTHYFSTGTSFATPHVAGIAALLKAADPSLAGGSLKEAILAGGDAVTAFASSGSTPVATGDRANAADALRRPQFTFAPASPANADSVTVTGSAPANAGDYATAQVFTNGSCSGAPAATGTLAAFTGAGLDVGVSQDATTQFTARYVDAGGNGAICSQPQSFTEAAPPASPEPPASPAPPGVDNAFTIGKLKKRRLTLTVPGAGVIDVNDANASKKKLLLKHSSATASGAGTIKVTLKLTKTANKKLKENGKVRVEAAITFSPTGGAANTQHKRLKVKQ